MRFALALILTCCLAQSVFADDRAATDSSSASVSLAPVKKLSEAEKRALELDELFAEIHKPKLPTAASTSEKIITLWMHNDSPTAELLLTQATKAMNDKAFDTSETMMDTVLASYPDYSEAWNRRATLYFSMKRYDEALADFDKVLNEEPRHFGALSGRGFVFLEQKKYREAAEAFKEALAINPNMLGIQAALKQLQHDYPDI